MPRTISALTRCSSAFGRPRSAKTFPLLFVTLTFFIFSLRVGCFCVFKATFDLFDLGLGRLDARLRFLLEGVQYVQNALHSDGINRSKSIAVEIGDDLQNAGTLTPLQRLSIRMLATLLSGSQGEPNALLYLDWKRTQIILR